MTRRCSSEAFHGLETLGICRAKLMPYEPNANAHRKPSMNALENARSRARRWRIHWVRRWNTARPLDDAELRAIKQAVAAGHPVACGLRWPNDLQGHVLSEVPNSRDVFDGHSIVLAGYTDNPQQNGGGSFLFRNSNGTNWGEEGYGRMSYAYARAYANDALWLEYDQEGSEVPVERFEAESMTVESSDRCEVITQNMAAWGGPMWGGSKQLFCRSEKGGSATLEFSIRRRGRYRLQILATAAPDFGALSTLLDGKPLGPVVDLYSGRVCPSGPIELGVVDLESGRHTLRCVASDKDPASSNFFFGLDAVQVAAAK